MESCSYVSASDVYYFSVKFWPETYTNMWLLSTLSFLFSVLITPFLTTLLCIVFLAAIGKSIGVRRLYVKILLMIFEVSLFSRRMLSGNCYKKASGISHSWNKVILIGSGKWVILITKGTKTALWILIGQLERNIFWSYSYASIQSLVEKNSVSASHFFTNLY